MHQVLGELLSGMKKPYEIGNLSFEQPVAKDTRIYAECVAERYEKLRRVRELYEESIARAIEESKTAVVENFLVEKESKKTESRKLEKPKKKNFDSKSLYPEHLNKSRMDTISSTSEDHDLLKVEKAFDIYQ